MEIQNLLHLFHEEVHFFNNAMTDLKRDISRVGLEKITYNYLPVNSLVSSQWIIAALKKLQYDTSVLEKEIKLQQSEIDELNQELHGDYYRQLFVRLGQLVISYESYFENFTEYKRRIEKSPSEYNDYVEMHSDGIQFDDEDDFCSLLFKRNAIEDLLFFLKDRFDLQKIQETVDNLDIIFQRDMRKAMNAFDIPDRCLKENELAPENYWWFHIRKKS